MYFCTQCGQRFKKPIFSEEKHGLDFPPFEVITGCPKCGRNSFLKED